MKVAIVGNPNTGKSTLFNSLTGLSQKIANYSGATVSLKKGTFLHKGIELEVIDLPGIYSVFPNSEEEKVTVDYLLNLKENKVDFVLFVIEPDGFKKNLFLFSQVLDLGIPCLLCLNRSDLEEKNKFNIGLEKVGELFNCNTIKVSRKDSKSIENLKDELINFVIYKHRQVLDLQLLKSKSGINKIDFSKYYNVVNSFQELDTEGKKKLILKESIFRYKFINDNFEKITSKKPNKNESIKKKLDSIFMHKVYGYLIFFLILFGIFQLIFSFATIPMDFIEGMMRYLSSWIAKTMPKGSLNSLISDAIIPGITGVIIFIPQIVILFLLLGILEQTGYLARVIYLSDRFMKSIGLGGKSVIPLLSGLACSIPAIMSARTIENKKERLITILITPFITCSARLPVYMALVTVIVPTVSIGIFNIRGFVLFVFYFLGFIVAFLASFLLKKNIHSKKENCFIVELPSYAFPDWKIIFLNIYEKTKAFIWEAGKIIFAVSIILWFLGSYSFGDSKKENQSFVQKTENINESILADLGKSIEPIIKPMGYDWKIGIGLVSSVAAREVFIGTMNTIYGIEFKAFNDLEESESIVQKFRAAKNPDGRATYTLATCLSLMVFYALALQCVSTIAVVYKETQSFFWTAGQFVGMTLLAYLGAWLTFIVFS